MKFQKGVLFQTQCSLFNQPVFQARCGRTFVAELQGTLEAQMKDGQLSETDTCHGKQRGPPQEIVGPNKALWRETNG